MDPPASGPIGIELASGQASCTGIVAVEHDHGEHVQCNRCGHENLPGSRFCAQCGNQLETVCPVCSAAAPPDARFCSNCGSSLKSEGASPPAAGDLTRHIPPEMLSKITEARSARTMQGERRTVTMLFADIQGSTAAAEGLDPEDWGDIMNGAFEHLIAPVYRYEGTLARLLGDAVLAFFGAPIAHEDDPIRAVRTGLEIIDGMTSYNAQILERWGIPINVRVGINTGLVVVGEVGSDLRVEYTALGDAVNVAARMEQTADPGTVRVTAETWAQVADHFDGEEIGPVEVKGKSEPVTAVRVLGVCAPAEDATEAPPLVGRMAELEELARLRDRLAGGSGWIAAIMGEAGVGKSRLLDEFRHRSAEAGPLVSSAPGSGEIGWMTAYSESYDSAIPYSTITDLLGRWWNLDGSNNAYEAIEDITRNVVPDLPDAARYLGYVAAVPLPDSATEFLERLEPPTLHGRARQAVIDYIEAEANIRPTVVALEDVHWADPMSLTLLEDLMRLAEKAPLGIVFSMRPYRDEPTWHVHEVGQRDHAHRYHLIDLATLETDDTQRLLDTLLEGVSVTDETCRRILERSDGNPLFIEQMARAIRDEGPGGEIAVPTGLSALLTARLDRLPTESKMVAQMASVIGSEFDRSTLEALVGEEADLDSRLTDLLRREVFVERADRPGGLGFHHALMHDAAYSTMLLRTRRQLHGRVADHLAAATPEAPQEIARHYVEAGDMASAFPHLVAAGEKSSRSMALSDAIRFFTTALERIPMNADPDLVVRAHDGLGVAYTLVPDLTQSEAAYQRLVDYADTTGRPSAKVTALNRLAMTTATLAGNLEGALGFLDEARAIAEDSGDERGLAEYHMNACTIAGLGGDVGTALFHDEETVKVGEALGSAGIRIEGMIRLATNAVWMMDFERAGPAVEDAVEAAREIGDELGLAILDGMVLSRLRLREGDPDGALDLLLGSVEILDRYASFYTPLVHRAIGTMLYEKGEIESAISRIAEVRRAVTEQNATFFVAVSSSALALIYSSLGVGESAAEMRDSAVAMVGAPLGNFLASTVWADLGHARLAAEDHDGAVADFANGLKESSASQYWEKHRLLTGMAMARAAQGDPVEAHRLLDEAQTFLMGNEVRGFDAQMEYARGVALLAEGKAEEALERLAAALEQARSPMHRLLAIRIRTAAARAAVAAGDLDAAASHVAEVRGEVDSIARSFIDEGLRAAMIDTWLAPLDQIVTG